MLDLLLRDGSLVDGTGAPPRSASVGVAGGRIVAVGDVDEPANRVIDLNGLVVAPGFIDLHCHYDAQLFWDGDLSPSPLHGVTTSISGNCGLTLAPAAPRDRDFLSRLLARVESIPVDALLAGVDYRWESYPDFLDVVERTPHALNVGFLVGHSALRRAVMGQAASERAASAAEINSMTTLLDEAIAAGGLGFSTASARTQVDGDGNPTPPIFAAREEFLALSAVCGRHPGTSLEFIPGSFPEGFSDDDMELMADMSADANRHLNWNTPLLNKDAPGLYGRQLSATDVARERGGWVVPMFMPQSGPLQHDFLRGYVFRALPGWAKYFDLDVPARCRAFSDPAVRKQMYDDVATAETGLAVLVRDWASYYVNEAVGDTLAPLNGRSVGDIAAERGVSPFDAMLDVAVAADLEVGFVRYQYPSDPWTQQARADVLKDPRVVLGASDAGAHGDMMVGADFPTRSLAELVRDKQLLTLEEMVHQFTDVPARLYGLVDRGRIEQGAWADLVVFDPDRVGAAPLRTVRDLPAGAARLTTSSEGVQHVFVAGTPVVSEAVLTGDRPGQLVRSGRDTRTVPARPTEKAGQ
jgi:N-acyl-D-aspartate/D-glutamate deacylase